MEALLRKHIIVLLERNILEEFPWKSPIWYLEALHGSNFLEALAHGQKENHLNLPMKLFKVPARKVITVLRKDRSWISYRNQAVVSPGEGAITRLSMGKFTGMTP